MLNPEDYIQVESSNIDSVGYDSEEKFLYVRFRGSGSLYRYANVEPEVVDRLIGARSIGKEFHRTIKNGYAYTKVE